MMSFVFFLFGKKSILDSNDTCNTISIKPIRAATKCPRLVIYFRAETSLNRNRLSFSQFFYTIILLNMFITIIPNDCITVDTICTAIDVRININIANEYFVYVWVFLHVTYHPWEQEANRYKTYSYRKRDRHWKAQMGY